MFFQHKSAKKLAVIYFVCHNVKLTNSKEIAGHFGWTLWQKCSMSQRFHPLQKLSAGMCR